MELSGLKRSLSRFELGVCIIIISVLIYYAIVKISELTVQTEITGIRVIIRNMHSNLDLYKSEFIISGRTEAMTDMIGANPVGKIFPPMQNYRGEFDAPDPLRFSPGDWYFDRTAGHLVYLVIHTDRFLSPVAPPPRIRLVLQPVYRDRNSNGRYDSGIDMIRGLRLDKVEPYEWR